MSRTQYGSSTLHLSDYSKIITSELWYCCTTVRNLELLIESQAANVRPLQALFPNVSHLSFKFVDSRTDEADFTMLIQIFECWSDLETLGCSVECGNWGSRSIQKPPRRNYDADFLGIHEEEAELLRQKDEEFLRRVHIVPIRPSVLTMSSKFPDFKAFAQV